MKTISYGILAEDSACKIFAENAIPQLQKQFCEDKEIEFEHNKWLTSKYKLKGKNYVLRRFINLIRDGLVGFDVDVCFVGVDADDESYEDNFKTMKEQLTENDLNDKAIIYIPVQAIEYWLWYLKLKYEKPELDISEVEAIESETRREMKKLLYHNKKTTKYTNEIVERYSNSFNINWLRQCSNSFDAFVNEFENYINKLNG